MLFRTGSDFIILTWPRSNEIRSGFSKKSRVNVVFYLNVQIKQYPDKLIGKENKRAARLANINAACGLSLFGIFFFIRGGESSPFFLSSKCDMNSEVLGL